MEREAKQVNCDSSIAGNTGYGMINFWKWNITSLNKYYTYQNNNKPQKACEEKVKSDKETKEPPNRRHLATSPHACN